MSRYCFCFCLLVAAWLPGFPGSLASAAPAPAPPSEYQVKAAFLYNFAKFTEWPEGAVRETIQIGVLGDDPFGDDLDKTVANKTINGKPFAIVRARALAELMECHILFIGASERRRLPEIINQIGARSILTVSDSEQFAAQGGVVEFTMEADKVRFKINTRAAQQAQLRLSSKLLTLSR